MIENFECIPEKTDSRGHDLSFHRLSNGQPHQQIKKHTPRKSAADPQSLAADFLYGIDMCVGGGSEVGSPTHGTEADPHRCAPSSGRGRGRGKKARVVKDLHHGKNTDQLDEAS